MKASDFEKLSDGVKQAGTYQRGESNASRITDLELPPIREIREAIDLTQQAFADRICVNVRTLQHWEQGTRSPTGPARKLLEIAHKHPEIFEAS